MAIVRLHLFLAFLAGTSPFLSPACSAAPKIGVLLKGKSDFWASMEKGAREAGEKLGADLIIKSPPAETDIAIQIRLLNAMAAQGIQALVIAPTNKDSLAGPVAALAATGVKIVVMDSPLAGAADSVFVGTDQRAAGEAAGALLAELVANTDEVSFLKHDQSGGATQQREIGAFEKLRALHPEIVVHGDVYASTEAGRENEKAEFLLEKYPAAKAIFTSGTPETMAMLQTLDKKKAAGAIKLVGFGFNLNPTVVAALKNGTLAGLIAQLPEDVGYKGVQSAVALVNGEKVAPVISTDFLVVTKNNLSDPKVQTLLRL